MTMLDQYSPTTSPTTPDALMKDTGTGNTDHPDQAQINNLTDENTRLLTERDQAAAERDRYLSERDQATAAHQQFLITLGEVAKDAAEEHNWCSVARNLVEELGAPWPDPRGSHTMIITRTWTITADAHDSSQVTASFILDSLHDHDGAPQLDDDWEHPDTTADSGYVISDHWPN